MAMLEYVEKVTLNAYKVTPEDIEKLREHGFTDGEILDIAIVAAWRAFYSKVLDAVGTEPDEIYKDMEEQFLKTMVVGRIFGNFQGIGLSG